MDNFSQDGARRNILSGQTMDHQGAQNALLMSSDQEAIAAMLQVSRYDPVMGGWQLCRSVCWEYASLAHVQLLLLCMLVVSCP